MSLTIIHEIIVCCVKLKFSRNCSLYRYFKTFASFHNSFQLFIEKVRHLLLLSTRVDLLDYMSTITVILFVNRFGSMPLFH